MEESGKTQAGAGRTGRNQNQIPAESHEEKMHLNITQLNYSGLAQQDGAVGQDLLLSCLFGCTHSNLN